MTMHDNSWTTAEKKIARRAFDLAVQTELQELIVDFKAKASSVEEPATVWEIRDWLNARQREIDSEYDYRYSQLIFVFARLVRKGRLDLAQLTGLSDDKLLEIRHIAEL